MSICHLPGAAEEATGTTEVAALRYNKKPSPQRQGREPAQLHLPLRATEAPVLGHLPRGPRPGLFLQHRALLCLPNRLPADKKGNHSSALHITLPYALIPGPAALPQSHPGPRQFLAAQVRPEAGFPAQRCTVRARPPGHDANPGRRAPSWEAQGGLHNSKSHRDPLPATPSGARLSWGLGLCNVF